MDRREDGCDTWYKPMLEPECLRTAWAGLQGSACLRTAKKDLKALQTQSHTMDDELEHYGSRHSREA